MPTERVGLRPVGIILAAVVLLMLSGLLIYLAWRDAKPKRREVPQRASICTIPEYLSISQTLLEWQLRRIEMACDVTGRRGDEATSGEGSRRLSVLSVVT